MCQPAHVCLTRVAISNNNWTVVDSFPQCRSIYKIKWQSITFWRPCIWFSNHYRAKLYANAWLEIFFSKRYVTMHIFPFEIVGPHQPHRAPHYTQTLHARKVTFELTKYLFHRFPILQCISETGDKVNHSQMLYT